MRDDTKAAVPPIPVGLEDLVGMAAASPAFAAELAARRDEAVAASGVELAPTEAAVLGAVDDAALLRMIERCRAQQAGAARRAFLGRASAALLLLVGAGAMVGCEKKGRGDKVQAPGQPSQPDNSNMRPAAMVQPDASVSRERPRPKRPAGVKTGISPEHRRPQKLDLETGIRVD